MKAVVINRFDGGIAEDVRTTSNGFSEENKNFDIYTKPHSLVPKRDMVAETFSGGTITDYDITDVVPATYSGDTYIFGYGRESAASTKVAFFKKSSTTDITSAWESVVVYSASTNTPIAGTLVNYQGKLHAITTNNLIELTNLTTITSKGNVVGTATSPGVKPFEHPDDKILYFATDNVVGSYDGTTFDNTVFTLPSTMKITSLTSFGGYLAIAAKPTLGIGRSYVFFWNRDTSITTADGLIDWGDNALEILENIGEVLVGVSTTKAVGAFTNPRTNQDYKYAVSVYGGGTVQTIAEFTRSSYYELKPFKAKDTDKLYFGFDTDNVVYAVGKNKNGRWFVSGDSFVTPTGSFPTGALTGLSLVSDTLFTSYTDGGVSGYLTRTGTTYSNTSVYTTTINPGMDVSDRYALKKLKAIQVAYNVKSSNGTVTVGYYENEGATLRNVISENKTASGQYVARDTELQSAGGPFHDAEEYKFRITSTGNVEIKELRYVYEIIPTLPR